MQLDINQFIVEAPIDVKVQMPQATLYPELAIDYVANAERQMGVDVEEGLLPLGGRGAGASCDGLQVGCAREAKVKVEHEPLGNGLAQSA